MPPWGPLSIMLHARNLTFDRKTLWRVKYSLAGPVRRALSDRSSPPFSGLTGCRHVVWEAFSFNNISVASFYPSHLSYFPPSPSLFLSSQRLGIAIQIRSCFEHLFLVLSVRKGNTIKKERAETPDKNGKLSIRGSFSASFFLFCTVFGQFVYATICS